MNSPDISDNGDLAAQSPLHPMDRLKAIMERLRSENGCPWDKEQTHQTLIPCLLEEAYEVVSAIETNDMDGLREELGDLLFQSVFHARLAEEQNLFTIEDVILGISEKLVRRHPHVFGTQVGIRTANQVVEQWEAIKSTEKKSHRASAIPPSVLDSVPISLPAIQKADKIQAKVAKLGFDWEKWQEPVEKLWEEIGELREELGQLQAILAGNPEQMGKESLQIPIELRERIESEMGDVIFSLVNVSRHLGISAETALRKTNDKFSRRFRFIESESALLGKNLKEMSLAQMDELWEQAKAKERSESSEIS